MNASLKGKLHTMKWAEDAIEQLSKGEVVQVRPRGCSMSGRIEDGQLVTLEPVALNTLNVCDIVLVRVEGKKREVVVLHQILELDGARLLIGAHNGRIDGWVEAGEIFGRAVRIEA